MVALTFLGFICLKDWWVFENSLLLILLCGGSCGLVATVYAFDSGGGLSNLCNNLFGQLVRNYRFICWFM